MNSLCPMAFCVLLLEKFYFVIAKLYNFFKCKKLEHVKLISLQILINGGPVVLIHVRERALHTFSGWP